MAVCLCVLVRACACVRAWAGGVHRKASSAARRNRARNPQPAGQHDRQRQTMRAASPLWYAWDDGGGAGPRFSLNGGGGAAPRHSTGMHAAQATATRAVRIAAGLRKARGHTTRPRFAGFAPAGRVATVALSPRARRRRQAARPHTLRRHARTPARPARLFRAREQGGGSSARCWPASTANSTLRRTGSSTRSCNTPTRNGSTARKPRPRSTFAGHTCTTRPRHAPPRARRYTSRSLDALDAGHYRYAGCWAI